MTAGDKTNASFYIGLLIIVGFFAYAAGGDTWVQFLTGVGIAVCSMIVIAVCLVIGLLVSEHRDSKRLEDYWRREL